MGPLVIGVAGAVAGAALALAWGAHPVLAFVAYSVCGAVALVVAATLRAYGPGLAARLRGAPAPPAWRPDTAFR